ncbi:MAG TPA: hypothetical protein VMF11_08905, partial [Candidatus Baltobacteraceae bacterium]|nr:hypothetical protein [Candidatus Baltobacteraceae bacterium]
WGDGQTLDYADSVLRHYSQLGASAPVPLPQAPRMHFHHHQHGHWRSVTGTDATGHRAGGGMSIDDYVNGGNSSS